MYLNLKIVSKFYYFSLDFLLTIDMPCSPNTLGKIPTPIKFRTHFSFLKFWPQCRWCTYNVDKYQKDKSRGANSQADEGGTNCTNLDPRLCLRGSEQIGPAALRLATPLRAPLLRLCYMYLHNVYCNKMRQIINIGYVHNTATKSNNE